MNMRWLKFPFQPNINAKTTLAHQHWTNVTLSKLFYQRWSNVGKHTWDQLSFQPNFKVETTLVLRGWIDVVLLTLFPRCFLNVETTSINVRRVKLSFSTKYQRWCVCWETICLLGRPILWFINKPRSNNLFKDQRDDSCKIS